MTIPFRIGKTEGIIQFAEVMIGEYSVSIIYERIRIAENRMFPLDQEKSKNWIQVEIDDPIPQSINVTLTGKKIDKVIDLPQTLQQIITNHAIEICELIDDKTIIRLNSIN
jgi:hypothetical protein